ncbi:MAG: kinase/pyrophosphorylase [candidate division Zixibacteria bacterium]|nr:kinase/pyrophosphorylase [candidate division Zixibacteria bacterium]
MAQQKNSNSNLENPPIYIVSGGAGDSGQRVVESVLVQYPGVEVPILKRAYIHSENQLDMILSEAGKNNGTVVHTLVEHALRKYLIKAGKDKGVYTIDLMGELFNRFGSVLGQKSVEQPGLYRRLHKSYFDRVDAIDFTIKHDDGQNYQNLHQADIVITGVSRTGKTPLSMYLAVMGWKVANVPLVVGAPVPEELTNVDRNRVIGLDIDIEQLLLHRRKRQEQMGVGASSIYTNPKNVYEELEFAISLCKKHRFSTIMVTNKPIESSASEIIEIITRRFKEEL